MTSSGDDPRGAAGEGRQGWPFGTGEAAGTPTGRTPTGGAAGPATGAPTTATAGTSGTAGTVTGARPAPARTSGARTGRRRPPVWVLVVAAVVLVGLVVGAVLWFGDRGADGDVPEAGTVTLPVPTPTVEPIAYEPPTAFAAALPTTVLAHALSEAGEQVSLLVGGAVEGYRLVYTDGATPVTLLAGQWETPEEASATYAALVQAQTAAVAAGGAGDAGDGEEGGEGAASTDVQEGPVTTVDGTETGRFTLVPRGDGTGTLTWWNGTAVLQLDGPAEELRDLFTAFPL